MWTSAGCTVVSDIVFEIGQKRDKNLRKTNRRGFFAKSHWLLRQELPSKITCFAVSSSEGDSERNVHDLCCAAKFPHTTLKLLQRYFIPKIQQFLAGDPLVRQNV